MPPALATLDVSHLPGYAHDWALVDVETSGLVARRDRILSLAVLTFGPDGTQTGEFSTLVDPGCDPGPVHVHGLTRERLRGAPAFDRVAERVAELLRGRVMVAHNARFDYDFLAHEFARAGLHLPVTRRLCTLALNRRVDPPTGDLGLTSLAAHYGVPQTRVHDALDDTRVLAGVFRASLAEAVRLDLPLPLVACPPRQDPRFAPKPPKVPCANRNPGRLAPGGPLVQGMKVAITGETGMSRAELTLLATAAGLNVMGSVSRHTSVLVTNDGASGSTKARRALAEGVPVLDEEAFLALLKDVRPGTPHEGRAGAGGVGGGDGEGRERVREERAHEGQAHGLPVPGAPAPSPEPPAAADAPSPPPPVGPAAPAVPAPRRPAPPRTAEEPRATPPFRPFGRRRVLVLGGTHEEAAAARSRVVDLGGSAAIRLSASVTDVVVLAGGERDRRMGRVGAMGLPVREPAWLASPTFHEPVFETPKPEGPAAPAVPGAEVLPRGGVIDLPGLPAGGRWHVGASWARQEGCEIDVVAFVLDEDEQVSGDGDFVFYGAPESPDGAALLCCDGPTEQTVALDLAALSPAVRRIAVAAAIDGAATFGDVGAVQLTLAPGADAGAVAQATLDAATSERTLLLAEVYRRGPLWRFRAVGQGYDHDLAGLARSYGVDVEDPHEAAAPTRKV
ncbi:TerD family protein [Streptomyces sp. NPDC046275]|uniref:TerD family protein n=1 Tax=Streptomyces sp. NPDC046275 TaxID=3157201 RepID=UPI0033D5372E